MLSPKGGEGCANHCATRTAPAGEEKDQEQTECQSQPENPGESVRVSHRSQQIHSRHSENRGHDARQPDEPEHSDQHELPFTFIATSPVYRPADD